jgi:tRNA-dihydrouridine synthase A
MMDWSDRHCRYMWRLLSKNTLLYTEMVTSAAICHAPNIDRFLDYSDQEHPIALQVGGSQINELVTATQCANRWGYDEINLNVGCPSDRVQQGMIGAVLMGHAPLVADVFKAMSDVANMPVTIKHRIGIDDKDDYGYTQDFVSTLYNAGCRVFIVHARSAILNGLSPKENREIPPLKYESVYQLKRDFPDAEIVINGGIKTLGESQEHLRHVDGVMIGREAYQNPMILSQVDRELFGGNTDYESAVDLLHDLVPYIDNVVAHSGQAKFVLRHCLGLIQGVPGARGFRRHLSENMHKPDTTSDLLLEAISSHLTTA